MTEDCLQTVSLRAELLRWYEAERRDLPWRRTRDPYAIWVSEVMLQQTRVDTVIDYYHRFLATFPSVEALAAASQEQVLKCWEGLGYYARARNLHRAAGQVVERHGGVVPLTPEGFRALPGVGEYIAAAVLSIAGGEKTAVVDGNVKRVVARLFAVDAPVNDAASMKVFRSHAAALLDERDPGAFNQAVMELGALVCLPRQPRCGDCPVEKRCVARRRNAIERFPVVKPRPKTPLHHIAVGVVTEGKKLLITKRAEEGLLGGLWEFPGGKIREGESAAEACRREIREETGLDVRVGERIAEVRHAYTHFKIVLRVFLCERISGTVRLDGPTDYRWVAPSALDDYPFPKANLKFIPTLRARLEA